VRGYLVDGNKSKSGYKHIIFEEFDEFEKEMHVSIFMTWKWSNVG
jgi:hypothetical protein